MPICARLSTVADLRVLHLLRSQPLSATTLREPDAGCAQPRQCRCSLTLPFDEFGRGPEPDVETGNQHSLAGTSLHKDDFGMWIMHFRAFESIPIPAWRGSWECQEGRACQVCVGEHAAAH